VVRSGFVLLILIVVAFAAAESAAAQAGGGSSDYGGGGGGSGGGGGGGGGDFGAGGGDGAVEFSPGVVVILVAVGLLVLALRVKRGPIARARAAIGDVAARFLSGVRGRRRRERVHRVELAAAEAAQDDKSFATEAVTASAVRLFRDVQAAWDARDRERLAALLSDDLLAEWERRLADFDRKGWHNRVEVLDQVHVEYIGLTNREETGDDRAVVFVEAMLRAYVEDRNGRTIYREGESDDTIRVAQYWTLGRREGRWILLSIEERAEGEHQLTEPIVSSAWSDTGRLRDEAVIETAVSDGVPNGFEPADVADLDFDGDARAEALDLSLADARFAPDVLEASARRAVEAWAEAVDGDDTELARLASTEALQQLLYHDAAEKIRVVVRGPRVQRIAIVALDASREPATMAIEVELQGQRYVEDRDTKAVISGSRDEATAFTERWTLSLDGAGSSPWQITAVGHSPESPATSPSV
jgi:predicted lipid-binding transport protein (Tim44 family)